MTDDHSGCDLGPKEHARSGARDLSMSALCQTLGVLRTRAFAAELRPAIRW